MLQVVPTQQPRVVTDGFGEIASSEPPLGFAGSIAGSHALILAPNGLDLLCSLLRHGCAAATCLRLGERSEHDAYDLVFAPGIVSAALVGRIIYQAKRALVPKGRFLALVPATALDHDELGALLVRSLRLAGFAAIRTEQAEDGYLVRGDLPMHIPSAGMPTLARAQS